MKLGQKRLCDRYIRVRSERGLGLLTVLVFGALIASVSYCAYHILPFYYYYYELVGQMEALIRIASTETDQEIRTKILQSIKRMEIPADEDNLRIERDESTMRISLPYEEVFYITYQGKDHEIYRFKFHAYAEGQF